MILVPIPTDMILSNYFVIAIRLYDTHLISVLHIVMTENQSILMEKVKDVQYPIAGAYTDNSKEILKELVGDEMDENSDCEVEDGDNEIELIDE